MRFLRGKNIDPETRDTLQPRLWLMVAALVLIGGFLVAFIAENNRHVSVHFVLVTTQTSVIWLILLSLAIGFIGGILVSQLERRRRRHQRS